MAAYGPFLSRLSFYVTLPLVYRWILSRTARTGNVVLVAIAMASFVIWDVNSVAELTHNTLWLKLLRVSPIPNVHMFLVGLLLQRNYVRVAPWVEGKLAMWFVAYVGLMLLQKRAFGGTLAVEHVAPNLLPLARDQGTARLLRDSFAFSARGVSRRILRGNDISYGLYIYHALVMNLFLHLHLTGRPIYFFAAAACAVSMGALSWKVVEAPALRLKSQVRRPATSGLTSEEASIDAASVGDPRQRVGR